MRATRLLPLVSALLVIGVSAVAAEAAMDLEVARAASAGERPNVIITYHAGSKSRLRTYFEKDVIRGAFPKRDGGRPEGPQRPRSVTRRPVTPVHPTNRPI